VTFITQILFFYTFTVTVTNGAVDQTRWAEGFPACGGQKQSPIDIQRQNVRHNPDLLEPVLTGYAAQKGNFVMNNNGYTVLINLPPSMVITRGLPGQYTAIQMHLHWGGMQMESSGAEHTLDGIRYIAELHLVHYNSDKYSSFQEAKDKPDGLAVLAFFFVNGHFENTYYRDFINNLAKVKYAGQSMNISSLDLRSMLPENLNHFFRYQGSLTVPPCYESVLWTVFDTPITLSHNQIKKLETTLMNNNTMWDYYRMVQPLNDRVVESSFVPRLRKGTLCRQEEIESKLLRIEGMITTLAKHTHSEPRLWSPPMVLHFPERNTRSYAMAHLTHPMDLHSFTACMHVKTPPVGIHTVLSYSSQGKDNELMISIGYEVGLWIGNEFVNLPHNFHSHEWANYCVTWSSHSGGADLTINGLVGEEQYIRGGYTLSPAGVFILGKDQDGFLGISDADAFMGYMTDINVWDYVLTAAEIREQRSCDNKVPLRGNVFSWGVTPLSLYGGLQLETDYRCP
uniref:Carbonic anhydrase 6 n=1 Tax=Esox lucius TaxID=8010 RepID=A0A3P8YLL3_ESOLU